MPEITSMQTELVPHVGLVSPSPICPSGSSYAHLHVDVVQEFVMTTSI